MYNSNEITPEIVYLNRDEEKNIKEAMYNFVIRTTTNSDKATPAEVEVLPEIIKLLIDYWSIAN